KDDNVKKESKCFLCCVMYLRGKTIDQFELHGCDNCEEYLHLKNNRTAVYDCTSSNFDGFVALMDPKDSWVAKWQRAGGFVKGCYAISVTGRLPPGVVRSIKQKGVIYRSRDTSQKS
ncbi:transcription elongation factor SPT4, partial [Mytilus galloprovincialis]